MLSGKPSASYPCEGLYELTLHFGGEQESLPQDCRPTKTSDMAIYQINESHLSLETYRSNLLNPEFVPTAIRMAFLIGSLVFTLNHSGAFLKDEMTRSRWGMVQHWVTLSVNH